MEQTNSQSLPQQLQKLLSGSPGKPASEGLVGFTRRILPMLGVNSFHKDAASDAEPKILGTTAMTETRPDETTLSGRAAARTQYEAVKQQQNLEDVSFGAAPYIREDAKPNEVEEDWFANFFDRSRLVSDKDMQQLWSHILASEVNNPGRFSIRTVNLLASLSKSEAMLFRKLCSYVWQDISPSNDAPYVAIIPFDVSINSARYGLTTNNLFNLQDIGLISFHSHIDADFSLNSDNEDFIALSYHGQSFEIREKDNTGKILPKLEVLNLGEVMLSFSGVELAHICSPEPDFKYMDYILSFFKRQNMHITTI